MTTMKPHRDRLTDRTHCYKGHDLSLPNAIVKQANGYNRCRLCRNEIARKGKARFVECSVCHKAYERPTTWRYCSKACSRKQRTIAGKEAAYHNALTEAVRAEAILRLCDERERCFVRWERDELTARIDKLTGCAGDSSALARLAACRGGALSPTAGTA